MAAPAKVAAKFTTSLSTKRHPRARWTGCLCLGSSIVRPHAAQYALYCTPAPRRLSNHMPANPATSIAIAWLIPKSSHTHAAAVPIMAAPTRPANVPYAVIPPDSPGSTIRAVSADRGTPLAQHPISVAHVSAVAAARAPARATLGQTPSAPDAPNAPDASQPSTPA